MEQEKSQMNVNHTNNNESTSNELIENEKIEKTPFSAVRVDNQWFLTMGKYRLTEQLQTKEQVLKDAERSDWDRVLQVIAIMIEEYQTKPKK